MTELTPKPDITTQKQINHAGFHARTCATLIDLFCSMLLIFPLFKMISPLIYGSSSPQQVMQPIAVDAVNKMKEVKVPSIMDFIHLILNDPRTHQYFITDGGLLRIGMEQLMQIVFFSSLYLFFWIRVSATPGKVIMSLKIVDAETYEKPSRKQFFIRFFAYIVSAIPLGLGFLWVIFDKKKQGWHDKLAHTLVIKK